MPRKPTAEYDIKARDGSAAGWRQALKTADGAGKSLSRIMSVAFAGVSFAAISSAIKGAIEYGDEIGKAAEKAGIGARAMSELAHAAKMSDIEISSLSTAISKMQINASKAATGNKQLINTFKALGIDVQQFVSLDSDEQFESAAQAISNLRNAEDRARAATELFSKAGAELLPMFSQGAEGIRKAREEAVALGKSLSEEQVRLLQEGDDAIKKLGAAWDGLLAKMAVGTVKLAQAVDLIDKDQVGELKDQLAQVNEELRQSMTMPEGGAFDEKAYQRLSAEAAKLEQQIKNLNDTYSRGGGPRRGRIRPAAPGYQAPDKKEEIEGGFTREMRDEMRNWEEFRGFIDATDAGIRDGLDESLQMIEQDFRNLEPPISAAIDKLSIFSEEAARNMQDHFADFLFDPFDKGLKGMLKGFADTIRRMLAEAAAAKVFETFFGTGTSSGGGGGLAVGKGWMDYIRGLFGGFLAEGGPLKPGKWHIAGEHGPEPIWGGGAGAFAAGYGGGGGGASIDASLHIDARGATQDAVKELIRSMPEMQRRWMDAVESKIITGIQRRQYSLA